MTITGLLLLQDSYACKGMDDLEFYVLFNSISVISGL